jgi:hypothetical protein
LTQVGAPAIGEILADRYRIEEHVNDDSTGRQVWRGVDVILQRAVTIVLRTPGGADADEMLRAAVAASRVIHPNIVGVYDAIDEGTRAYVVREWVEGRALRDAVTEAPLEPSQAIGVARAVADALSAVHATGVSHGNVHPGTVLLSVDGRVVLGDARANDQATVDGDVRAVGAILYCALTGHWPRQIAGPAMLPDAPTMDNGKLAAPRQIRAGVPPAVDELAMDLLDPTIPAPGAAELSLELSRLGFHDPGFTEAGFSELQYVDAGYSDNGYAGNGYSENGFAGNGYPPLRVEGPLGFASNAQRIVERPRPGWKRAIVAVAGLLAIVLAGGLVGTMWLAKGPSTPPAASETNPAGGQTGGAGSTEPDPIKLTPNMIRLVDPPGGDRTENDGIDKAIDEDKTTGWSTDEYNSPRFGNLKPGMGLLIDLGSAKRLSAVHLTMSSPDATVAIRYGAEDFGDTSSGDKQIANDYKDAVAAKPLGATAQVPLNVKTQYLLIWITELPTQGGKYQVQIKEIQVYAATD